MAFLGRPWIRKVLVSTINHDHPQRGMEHAFRSLFGDTGVGVYDYYERLRQGASLDQVNAEFLSMARSFNPDWIWLQAQNTGVLQPDTLLKVGRELPGCVISHWMGDARDPVAPYLSGICAATHLTLVSGEGYLPLYKAAGAREVRYCQVAVDWEEDVLGIPEWTPPFRVPDVVFCGNYHGTLFRGAGDRDGAVRTLQAVGIDVGIVGLNWPTGWPVIGSCRYKEQHHIYKRAKIVLSVNNVNDVRRYYSDRHLFALASGVAVVAKYVPGFEDEFENGHDLMWYNTDQELVSVVRALLADEGARTRLGRNGRATAIRDHTWFKRILDVMPEVERIRAGL